MNYPSNADYCTCPTIWHGIYPPPPCPFCERMSLLAPLTYPSKWIEPAPVDQEPLSDRDIDRIAKRIADLLRDLL